MVFPLMALAILAVVVTRALMGVVAHEHGMPTRPPFAAEPTRPAHDEARALLSPAAADHLVEPVTESRAF